MVTNLFPENGTSTLPPPGGRAERNDQIQQLFSCQLINAFERLNYSLLHRGQEFLSLGRGSETLPTAFF